MSNISLFTPIQFSPSTTDNQHISGAGVAPLSTVTVFRNGVQLGTTVADAYGRWSYTLPMVATVGDVIYYSAIPLSQSAVVQVTASGAWTLNRIVNVAGGGTSISANAESFVAVSITNVPNVWTETYITRGYLCTLMRQLGWNYTPPRCYAVGGTSLAQDLTIYNGTSTTSPPVQRWGAIGSDGWHPDIFLLEGGSNDIAGGNTITQIETDASSVQSYLLSMSPKPQMPLLSVLPRNNFSSDAAMQSVRTQFNTWSMTRNTYDANIYPYDASSTVEDPGNPGHMLAAASDDGVHPNTYYSFAVGNAAFQQLSNKGLLPAPIVYPRALDAAADPTNLLQHSGAPNNAYQTFIQSGGSVSNFASGSVCPKGYNLGADAGLGWTTSAGAQPSSALVLDDNCTTRKKLVITIPNGNAPGSQSTASADISKTWITVNTGTVISAARASNYDGAGAALVAGDTYRGGMKVKINCPNCSIYGLYFKFAIDGTNIQLASYSPFGTFNAGDMFPQGTYDVVGNAFTIPNFQTSIQLTNLNLYLCFAPGMPVGGTVEISAPYIRKYNFIPSWPSV